MYLGIVVQGLYNNIIAIVYRQTLNMNALKCKTTGKLMVRNASNPKSFLRCGSSNASNTGGSTQPENNTQSSNDPIAFEFNDTFYDLTDTYEFQHHANGPMAIGVDKSIDLSTRGSAVVDLGNDFFSPYSFSIAFDYKTTVGNGAGDRLFFSTASDLDDGNDIDGFQITMYNQYLYLKTQKELAWPGYYFAPGPANISAFDFNNMVRMVFVFNHSLNHTEGDKNNIKIFVNGQMLLNQDIADGTLTEAERAAGVMFTNPQKLYLNRHRNAGVSTCSFDNIKIWRDALTQEEAVAASTM